MSAPLEVRAALRRVTTGVYCGTPGTAIHVDLPELLAAWGFDNTAENRQFWGRLALQEIRREFRRTSPPQRLIIARMQGVWTGGQLQ